MSVILIVEDSTAALRMAEYILLRAGYTILGAGRGDKALETFTQAEQVDMAIVDMGLPDMTGIDVLRRLREQSATLPIIMLTADSDPQLHEQALAAGAAMFLNKPLSSIELLMAVSKLLNP